MPLQVVAVVASEPPPVVIASSFATGGEPFENLGQLPHDYLPHPPSEIQPTSPVLDVSVGSDVRPIRGTGEPDSHPRVDWAASQSLITVPLADQNQLTSDQVRQVLADVGTPPEWVEALVAISWCESKQSPAAIGDQGNSVGMWQVNRATWFPYAGEDSERWADPHVNARVALSVARYSIARGRSPWEQWSCQP